MDGNAGTAEIKGAVSISPFPQGGYHRAAALTTVTDHEEDRRAESMAAVYCWSLDVTASTKPRARKLKTKVRNLRV